MNKITILTDYKGRFGSKHFDKPYRSGFDLNLLKNLFELNGIDVEYIPFCTELPKLNKTNPLLYTSSEDDGYYYKSYIEDVIYGLESAGYNIIPSYKYLRANNNKVCMEILRNTQSLNRFRNIKSYTFGTIEEFINSDIKHSLNYPIVIKKAEGASGSGVYKADSEGELLTIIKKISRTKNQKYELHDYIRKIIHKGYVKDSLYRKKYILQEFIPDLKNDWKVYIFGRKYYVFFRPVFKHRGFRASGGGYDNYFFGLKAQIPEGLLDFASDFFNCFNTPHISLDIAFDGTQFYILEFQFIYFGTAGILYSDGYYCKGENDWTYVKRKYKVEEVYVDSILEFLNK